MSPPAPADETQSPRLCLWTTVSMKASPGFGLGQASLGSGVRENREKKKEETEGGWTDGESVMMPKRR